MATQQLWNDMILTGYHVRSTGMDGLVAWQPYKTKYSSYTDKIQLKQDFCAFVRSLKYVDSDHPTLTIGDITIDNTQPNHFLIQHFRIPIMEKFELSVLKFAQLAYNVGQLLAVFTKEDSMSQTVKEFYVRHELYKFNTYV